MEKYLFVCLFVISSAGAQVYNPAELYQAAMQALDEVAEFAGQLESCYRDKKRQGKCGFESKQLADFLSNEREAWEAEYIEMTSPENQSLEQLKALILTNKWLKTEAKMHGFFLQLSSDPTKTSRGHFRFAFSASPQGGVRVDGYEWRGGKWLLKETKELQFEYTGNEAIYEAHLGGLFFDDWKLFFDVESKQLTFQREESSKYESFSFQLKKLLK